MKKESVRWIEAGKILATSPIASVRCPENDDAEIEVTDVPAPEDPGVIERHMRCPKCGAYNAILLHKANAPPQ
jgi:hypothetical protein